jgi:hypothetical protein
VGIEHSESAIDHSDRSSEGLWQFFGVEQESALGEQVGE